MKMLSGGSLSHRLYTIFFAPFYYYPTFDHLGSFLRMSGVAFYSNLASNLRFTPLSIWKYDAQVFPGINVKHSLFYL